MTEEKILQLIKQGEGIDIEFKESKERLNKDVFKSICAFLNRIGGHLILGVNDSGKIVGVNPEKIGKIKKELVSGLNNPQKLYPPVYLFVEDLIIDGKSIIYIYVPESSQVHRVNGRIYDRNEDGDLDITDRNETVALLYMRKQAVFSENKVFPYLQVEDLRKDLFVKIRKIISITKPKHIWLELTDIELLKSAGLYIKDFSTGQEGLTLAAALLFGSDEVLKSVLPYHGTDAIVRIENKDRYDDRLVVETNLIDSYNLLMDFIAKHLPDPFYLEDDLRVSLRNKIFREVISNTLIHREYLNPYPAKLIIEENKVTVENANKAHGFGVINPQSFSPFPKNPKIASFFRELGRADKLGSGIRNLYKYVPIYSNGALPQLVEDDVFKIIVPLNAKEVKTFYHQKNSATPPKTPPNTPPNTPPKKAGQVLLSPLEEKIFHIMKSNPSVTSSQIAEALNISRDTVKEYIDKLKQKKLVRHVGPVRGGWWEVNDY